MRTAAANWMNISKHVVAVVLAGTALGSVAQVQYVYDELGRLVQATAPDGASVQYGYDPAGNITTVRRWAANALSLGEFTPNRGPVGTSVTLYGGGFSPTATNNTVRFNGTPAAVSSATATSLTVTVPLGATSGKVSVSNTLGSVTSVEDYEVSANAAAPTLSSFTPDVGKHGDVVTLAGANFQLLAGDNKVAFGRMAATIVQDATSPSATQLKVKVPSPAASGRLSVSTPYGKTVSTTDFYALPGTVTAADVQFKGRLTVNGPPTAVSIATPGKKAILLFDGQVGQRLHLVSQAGTFSSNPIVKVYRWDGSEIESISMLGSGVHDFAAPLSSEGTYTAVLSTSSSSAGSINLQLITEASDEIVVDGSTPVNLAAGQNGRYTFSAEAGKGYGLAMTNLATVPTNTSVSVKLMNPAGTEVATCNFTESSSCDWGDMYFSVGGRYTVLFDPSGTASANFNAMLSKDSGGALEGVTAQSTVVIAREGQNALYTFNGSAGQNISLLLADNALDDGNSSTNRYTAVRVYRPSAPQAGSSAAWSSFGTYTTQSSAMWELPSLPESGTYKVYVTPSVLDKGSITLKFASEKTGALAINGSTPVSLVAGQNGRYTFTAEAGKGYGLALAAFSTVPANGTVHAKLLNTSGSQVASCSFNSSNSCDWGDTHFGVAGTYTVLLDPSAMASATFNAVLSEDSGGALTAGAIPSTVSIAREGQNALHTFDGTAGQRLSLLLSSNALDDGNSGTNNYTTLQVYRPSAGQVGYSYAWSNSGVYTTQASALLELPVLPESGTYKVYIGPTALDQGSINLQLLSEKTGTLTVDGSTAVSLATGQNGRYTFTAEAGKGYGLALANFSTVPGNTNVSVQLLNPSGVQVASCNFSSSNSCDWGDGYFAAAGSYTVVFDPSGLASASFNVLLSKDIGGTLTVGATASVATIAHEGQNGLYTFAGTTGQTLSVVLTGNTLDDGVSGTNNNTYVRVYRPSAASVGNSSAWSGLSMPTTASGLTIDLPSLPENGTYKVHISPSAQDKGSVNVQLVTR